MYMVKTPGQANALKSLLDRILRETDMSQAQLAALVPIDQSQLSRWKTGASRPRFESLVSLGETLRRKHPRLGIGPDELVSAGGYTTDAPSEIPAEAPSPEQADNALDDQITAAQLAERMAIMQQQQSKMIEEILGLKQKVDDIHRWQEEQGESAKRDTA